MTSLPPPPGSDAPLPLPDAVPPGPPPHHGARASNPGGDHLDRFANEPIRVEHLPQLGDEAFVPLHPRYRSGWMTLLWAAAVAALVGGIVLAAVVDATTVVLVVTGAAVALLVAMALLWNVEFRRLGYLVREHDVSLRSGVLTHRVATVPFSRVQHVSVRRGPFERLLGLATVDVNSAGPDISIPGLTPDDADRIKVLITERAGTDTPQQRGADR